jgi:hypothetical protein
MMELTNEHHHAITLAGTAALPSPYPATAQAFFVLSDWDSEQVIYVKLVQIVSSKHIITRLIRPEDIRAIRPKPTAPGTSTDPHDWPILSPAKTQKEISAGEAAIVAHATAGKLKYLEELWHAAVIVYLPEAASVLHRQETAMTAAESVERSMQPLGVCCPH